MEHLWSTRDPQFNLAGLHVILNLKLNNLFITNNQAFHLYLVVENSRFYSGFVQSYLSSLYVVKGVR